jgi:hypothetical protein
MMRKEIGFLILVGIPPNKREEKKATSGVGVMVKGG